MNVLSKQHQARPKIAVIGAGWAGLSAAVHLGNKAEVHVFEASKQAGGRARTLAAGRGDFSFLDNGQHILIGAYHGVRTLMQQIGVPENAAFVRCPLQWHMADGMQFKAASLPAPLHLLAGILCAKKLGFADKLRLLDSMRALQRRHGLNPPDISVGEWLGKRHTPRRLVAEFWQPLVWGALNTPLESASLNILTHVLQDGVWAQKSDSDYLLPKLDLGRIMAEPALGRLKKSGAVVHLESRVGHLQPLPSGQIEVNGAAFDGAVLAVAPYHAAALLPPDTPANIQTAYADMQYHAITTVYLRYAAPLNLPAAMTGLANGTAQWLIGRAALGGSAHEVAAVISVSDIVGGFAPDEWVARVNADVQTLCPDAGAPVAARVITEKRATTAAVAHRRLPDLAWLHHQHIYPAGDYLHPRYPATLEAAVQTGQSAAALCLNEWALSKRTA